MKGEKELIEKILNTEINIFLAIRDGSALMQHMEDFYYITLLEVLAFPIYTLPFWTMLLELFKMSTGASQVRSSKSSGLLRIRHVCCNIFEESELHTYPTWYVLTFFMLSNSFSRMWDQTIELFQGHSWQKRRTYQLAKLEIIKIHQCWYFISKGCK